MKRFLLAVLVLLTFTSCDMFIDSSQMEKPEIFFIGVGLNYRRWNRADGKTDGRSFLKNTENDLTAVTAQFEHLAEASGYDYRFVTYDDFSSKVVSGMSEYDFIFRSWSSENPEKEIEHYVGPDISGSSVSLRDFAENFMERLNYHLTDDRKDVPGKNDILIFYYTGHGLDNGLGPAVYYQTEYPIGRAAEKISEKDYIIPLPYLYIDELLFDEYEATAITLYDCCYSGYAIDNSDLGSIHNFEVNRWSNGVRDDKLLVPNLESIFTNTYLATFNENRGPVNRYHVTAAHATQTSYDTDFNASKPNQKKYGAFTYQLLDYLDFDFTKTAKVCSETENDCLKFGDVGDPKKKVYTVSDLYTHIYQNIGYETKTYATPNVTRSRYDVAFFMLP